MAGSLIETSGNISTSKYRHQLVIITRNERDTIGDDGETVCPTSVSTWSDHSSERGHNKVLSQAIRAEVTQTAFDLIIIF